MKYKIKDAIVSYENIQIFIKDRWVYIKPTQLIGLRIEGEIVKKKTRRWLE